jgi:predicted tellurium resistance membrane protein TerC
MIDYLVTLGMLTLLQAVLGFDNLLYISLASKRAPAASQAMVRKVGIAVAVLLRIGLLILLIKLIQFFQNPLFSIELASYIHGEFNLHSIIVLIGGAFIIYTATKEVLHMMTLEHDKAIGRKPQSAARVTATIVLMNLVFSFDSILSAMALSDVVSLMATAIVIGGVLMIWLADHVSTFLEKNRMYEVLGLFILFVVGIMLVSEGGHLAHLELFGNAVMPMTKTTFYFVITVLVLCDVVQTRYKRKLMAR